MKNRIAIKTDWGSHIGFGHAQRMLNFLAFMNRSDRADVFFMCKNPPDFFPDEFRPCIINDLSNVDLIIRDMRDSSVSEIDELGKYAPVLALDDNGPGRNCADLRMDLLPNPLKAYENPDYNAEAFLFGYNFTESIKGLCGKVFEKDIDCAIYAGNSPAAEKIEYMKSVLPAEVSGVTLSGGNNVLMIGGTEERAAYGEVLLRTKVLVTYFGITLYEGAAAGCSLLTVNPGEYHSRLCEIAPSSFDLLNAGTVGKVDPGPVMSFIREKINLPAAHVSANSVIAEIENRLSAFAVFTEKRLFFDDKKND